MAKVQHNIYYCDMCGSEVENDTTVYSHKFPVKYFMDMVFGVVITITPYGDNVRNLCKVCAKSAIVELYEKVVNKE